MKELLLPGEEIFEDDGYIRGHGTQLKDGKIASTYFGKLGVTNKLVTVDPMFPLRYSPEVGDVVIGRILNIHNKRWNVELNSKSGAYLSLSAINLPGAVQRRKQESDEISMRSFFDINDLVVSEVQKINKNGSAALHTRNERYRKLSNGVLEFVPHFLLSPLKSRFLSDGGVEVIAGCNGYVWIGNKGDASSLHVISSLVSRIKDMVEAGNVINMEKLLLRSV